MEASMENLYVLEKQAEMKLREARAMSARAAFVSSLCAERRRSASVLAALATMRWARWFLRRTVRGRGGSLAPPAASSPSSTLCP